MSEKFEYYVGKYGATADVFDASRWGMRLFIGAALFAVAVMFFFWSWQAPYNNMAPVNVVNTVASAQIKDSGNQSAPADEVQAPSVLKVLVPGTTDVHFCIDNGDVDKFNQDPVYNELVLNTVAHAYSHWGKEVSTTCE